MPRCSFTSGGDAVEVDHVGRRRLDHPVAHRDHRHAGQREPARAAAARRRRSRRGRTSRRRAGAPPARTPSATREVGDHDRAPERERAHDRPGDRLGVDLRVDRTVDVVEGVEAALDAAREREERDEQRAHDAARRAAAAARRRRAGGPRTPATRPTVAAYPAACGRSNVAMWRARRRSTSSDEEPERRRGQEGNADQPAAAERGLPRGARAGAARARAVGARAGDRPPCAGRLMAGDAGRLGERAALSVDVLGHPDQSWRGTAARSRRWAGTSTLPGPP